MRDLALDQPLRKVIEPEDYEKIGALVERLREVLGDEKDEEGDMTWEGGGREKEDADADRPDRDDVKRRKTEGEDKFEPFPQDHKPTTTAAAEEEKPFIPFTISLDDPAGNSFLQFIDSISDPKWTLRSYVRTRAQDESLGMMAASGPGAREGADVVEGERTTADEEWVDKGEGQFANEEVYSFPSKCGSCGGDLDTLMKKVNIPYFQVSPVNFFHPRLHWPEHGCSPSFLCPPGNHHHVHQLPLVWLQGQRGQVGRCRVRSGKEDHPPGRGRRGPLP